MPNVLRAGPYRFYFYSHEPNEPPHVHVDRDDSSAKFWLKSVNLASNIGFREPQKNKVPAGPLPNPSPKFGRGTPEAGLMSPFSQAWEKGLGDEGLGTLFTRGSLSAKELRKLQKLVEKHQTVFLEAWNGYFGD